MPSVMEAEERTSVNETDELLPKREDPEATKLKAKRRRVFVRLGIMAVLCTVGGVGVWLWACGREQTDDAYVDAHISNISAKISGNIEHVYVTDNQLVKAGQLLVELDPRDFKVRAQLYQAALSEAKHRALAAHSKIGQSSLSALGQSKQASAELSSTETQIASNQSRISQSQAETRQATAKISELEAQVKFAEADYNRYQAVYRDRVVTKQQLEKAKTSCDIAMAQLAQAKHDLSAAHEKELQARSSLAEAEAKVRKSQGGITSAQATARQESIDQEQYQSDLAAVEKAEADLAQANLQLSYTRIVAPVDGRIGRKSAEIGQRVEPGQLLLAIVQENPWITANYKETQVGRMHPGLPVEITLDSFPGQKFTGTIDSVAPASGAKFSMLPPDNATGNFTKVVQRVPVKIVFDKQSVKPVINNLAPGMSCVTTVLIRR